MTLKIQCPGSFGWKAIVCTTNVYLRAKDETLKMRKDMTVKIFIWQLEEGYVWGNG